MGFSSTNYSWPTRSCHNEKPQRLLMKRLCRIRTVSWGKNSKEHLKPKRRSPEGYMEKKRKDDAFTDSQSNPVHFLQFTFWWTFLYMWVKSTSEILCPSFQLLEQNRTNLIFFKKYSSSLNARNSHPNNNESSNLTE